MYYFARVCCGYIASQPNSGKVPELRQYIVVDDGIVLYLAIQGGNEAELCFCATICL